MKGYTLAKGVGDSLPRLRQTIAFCRASADMLRTLIAIAQGGKNDTLEQIALDCDIGEDEVKAAISYWVKYGVIREGEDTAPVPEIYTDEGGIKLDLDFASVVDMCAEITGKAPENFSQSDKDNIGRMLDKYDAELILHMVKYYAEEKKDNFSFAYVAKMALVLAGKDVSTPEAFEEYVKNLNSVSGKARELFKIKGAFSDSQHKYVDKWTVKYKYSSEIFKLAYDKMMDYNPSQRSPFARVDSILTEWYDTGLKTEDDIRDFESKRGTGKGTSYQKKTQKKTQLNNNSFDAESAFRAAIERSVKDIEEEKDV